MKNKIVMLLLAVIMVLLCACEDSLTTKEGTEGLVYKAYEGGYIVTSYTGSEVNVVIPDTHNDMPVTGIAEECFEGSDIQSILIGRNVEVIEEAAFRSCTMLKEVTLSASLSKLGGRNGGYNTSGAAGVFAHCINLKKITFNLECPLEYIDAGTFSECELLESLILPNNVSQIGNWAFNGCTSLTNIEIPENVTSIGEDAFANCTAIKSIAIPETVTWVGGGAFRGFTVDQEIVIKGSTVGWAEYRTETVLKIPYSWDYDCNAKITYKKYDDSEMETHNPGQGILLATEIITYKENGSIVSKTESKYNADGIKIEEVEINFSEDGGKTSYLEYKMDESGYVSEESYYVNSDGMFWMQYMGTYEYNQSNSLMRYDSVWYTEEGIIDQGNSYIVNYGYYQDGTKADQTLYFTTEEESQGNYFQRNEFVYEYKDGNIVSCTKTTRYMQEDASIYISRFQYDEQQERVVSKSVYSLVNGCEELDSRTDLFYDDDGNLVRAEMFGPDDKLWWVKEYKYVVYENAKSADLNGSSEWMVKNLLGF